MAKAPATIATATPKGPQGRELAPFVGTTLLLPAAVLAVVVPFPVSIRAEEVTFVAVVFVAGDRCLYATRLDVKMLVALISSSMPSVPSQLDLYQCCPQVVLLLPPLHCFAAPTADPCRRGRMSDDVYGASMLVRVRLSARRPLKVISLSLQTFAGSQSTSDMISPPNLAGKNVWKVLFNNPSKAVFHCVVSPFVYLLLVLCPIPRACITTYVVVHICRATQINSVVIRPLIVTEVRTTVCRISTISDVPTFLIH